MANLYFEELEIGIRSAAGPYSLSKEEIIRFAKQYDPIPRHIDEELAAQSVFGGLTASGSHTFAIYILLSGQLQPHFQVLMGLGWDELKLTNPVRPGDALDLEMTVLELRPSKSKPDWGIVRNRNLLRAEVCELASRERNSARAAGAEGAGILHLSGAVGLRYPRGTEDLISGAVCLL